MQNQHHTACTQISNESEGISNFLHPGWDRALFLYKFITSPRKIGSITPSSSYLAQAMLEPINWSAARAIVELGAGTGVFTGYIRQNKHPDCQGIIFEQDRFMRERLVTVYPDLNYYAQAEDIYKIVQKLGLSKVDYVISGLPFANLPTELRDCIMDGIINALKPNGLFITFQYSLHMKKQLLKRFNRVDFRFVPLNIPPAVVYYCYK